VLLTPGFGAASGHLGAGFGVVGPLATVELVHDHGLVHQGRVKNKIEKVVADLNLIHNLTLDVS
jgi:hypothetical protein